MFFGLNSEQFLRYFNEIFGKLQENFEREIEKKIFNDSTLVGKIKVI